MRIPYQKEWLLTEREDYANYLFVVHTWEGFTYIPKKWGLVPGGLLGAEYINSACNLFILKEDFDKANSVNFQTLFTKPQLWDKLHKLHKVNTDKLFILSKKIKKLNVEKLSDRELLKWMDAFQEGQADIHVPRGPMWLLETPDNLVTNYLHIYLCEQYNEQKNIKIKPPEAFQVSILPMKKSTWAKENEGLAKIATVKQKEDRKKKLFLHAKKYKWLEYGLQGKILDLSYFKNRLSKIRRKGALRMYKKLQDENKSLSRKQKQVFRQYNIDTKHKKIFRLIQDSFYNRVYSKDSQFFGYYCIENLLKEIGRRSGLTLKQVRFLAPGEYRLALVKGKDFSKITNQRMKYSLHLSDKGKTIFYYGKKARAIRRKLKFIKEATKVTGKHVEIKGQPAYQGKAKGAVKIINTSQEMIKMHRGNILVSHMTNPDIVPAMKQARAIITDLGGITCHAAIVARELKIPCIIGTKIVTRVLKDGDRVRVDANKGIIEKL